MSKSRLGEPFRLRKEGGRYLVEVPGSFVRKARWKEGEELDWVVDEGRPILIRKEEYSYHTDLSRLSDRDLYHLYKSGRLKPSGPVGGYVMQRIRGHAERIARKAIARELES